MSIHIEPVVTIEACRTIEALQREIWQTTDLAIVPDHLLLTMAKERGVVLLATTSTGKPVGFAVGFIGLTADHRLKLASHMVGVLPNYQGQQVGYQLKLAQREIALALDIELMTWTYDPLQSRNARFNLHKLGAMCQTYLPNLYGAMRDEFNLGMPSDRFLVEWWLRSEHVELRLQQTTRDTMTDYPIVNGVMDYRDGLPLPSSSIKPLTSPAMLVEIPADINQLKETDLELAKQWQQQLRTIFQTAFTQKYWAIDLLIQGGRIFYLLQSK